MQNSNVFDELSWRGLVYDHSAGLPELLASEKVTVYNGFDATADSLHVGHMVPLMALARLQRFGHHPIALAGGGTSMIGDPSGKSNERQLMPREEIEANVENIKLQLAHFLDFESKANPARLLNNADWLLSLNLVEFLRDIGKHFTVNAMLTKDSVKTRLEKESGISFTEFSYMLLQSYDFLHLNIHEGCTLQTGGSDQWGNITTGTELIRRVNGHAAYALVYPLITKSDGTKFGKTESGAVWLSEKRTSPYRFFQFWLNTDDRDVILYLKFFTWIGRAEIESLAQAVITAPEKRLAQHTLADEMTRMVHGETALARARQASQVLFGGDLKGLTGAEILDIFDDVPSRELPASLLAGTGLPVVELLEKSGIVKSRGEARRLIGEGGVYLNNQRVSEPTRLVTAEDVIDGQFLVLRRGARNYCLVKILR